MWDHESQRLGKKRCTPLGYALHEIAELLGFIGLLLLIAIVGYVGFKASGAGFHASLLWLLVAPFLLGCLSEGLYRYSWTLALRKGFQYDYERCEASWLEQGQRRVYKWNGLTSRRTE
jgi:hypothetical protein